MNYKMLSGAVFSIVLFANGNLCYAEEWQTVGHFHVKGGLAKDTITGLTWMRCALGMKLNGKTCQDKATGYKWEKALQTPKGVRYAGYSDWRMPTIDELETLLDKGAGNRDTGISYIDSLAFPQSICNDSTGEACHIWSSSPLPSDSEVAWIIY